MSVDDLKKSPWFHNVEPAELSSFDDFTAWLEAILHNPCSVWEDDGKLFLLESKQLVARLNGLKIEIYSNEHPPPHFHVKSPNVDASFDIENCDLLKGKVSSRDSSKIRYWYQHAKPVLIEVWNSTRPGNCTVGIYEGT